MSFDQKFSENNSVDHEKQQLEELHLAQAGEGDEDEDELVPGNAVETAFLKVFKMKK